MFVVTDKKERAIFPCAWTNHQIAHYINLKKVTSARRDAITNTNAQNQAQPDSPSRALINIFSPHAKVINAMDANTSRPSSSVRRLWVLWLLLPSCSATVEGVGEDALNTPVSSPVTFSDYRQGHGLLVHKAVIGVEPHVLSVAALQKLPSSSLELAPIFLLMPSITCGTPLSHTLPAWGGWGFNVALGKFTEALKDLKNLFGPRLLSLRPTGNV
jgi:hypothetical protein